MDDPNKPSEAPPQENVPTPTELVKEKLGETPVEQRSRFGWRPSTTALFCIGVMLTLATGGLISARFHIDSSPLERLGFIGLVVLTFMLFPKKSRKFALVIFTIIAGIVFIGGTSMLLNREQAPAPFATYQIGHFADNADDPPIDFHEQLAKRPDSVRFVIYDVPEGAWSRIYKLPEKLRAGMCVEPYPSDDGTNSDMYIAMSMVKPDGSSYQISGPFALGSGFSFGFDDNYPMAFRIQGRIPHAISFRVSTIKGDGKCTG
jgi:hypothetical protein